ncbi:hypothetical protein C8F01DRAFT_1112344 [Mycena amicta]|nr:hypothetical protein C8F01DRAFT_1112344 [Mycena amicta]
MPILSSSLSSGNEKLCATFFPVYSCRNILSRKDRVLEDMAPFNGSVGTVLAVVFAFLGLSVLLVRLALALLRRSADYGLAHPPATSRYDDGDSESNAETGRERGPFESTSLLRDPEESDEYPRAPPSWRPISRTAQMFRVLQSWPNISR